MNYSGVKYNDIANGDKVRVSLWVSGCPHHCPNCFNQDTWDYDSGKPYDNAVHKKIMKALTNPWIDGLTILGGEPLAPPNIETVRSICTDVRRDFGNSKTIWIYTGYVKEYFDDPTNDPTGAAKDIFSMIDVLVDGPFIDKLKDDTRYRGSSNQRILYLRKDDNHGH